MDKVDLIHADRVPIPMPIPIPIPIPIHSIRSVHPENSTVRSTNACLSYVPDSNQPRPSTHALPQTTEDLSLVY